MSIWKALLLKLSFRKDTSHQTRSASSQGNVHAPTLLTTPVNPPVDGEPCQIPEVAARHAGLYTGFGIDISIMNKLVNTWWSGGDGYEYWFFCGRYCNYGLQKKRKENVYMVVEVFLLNKKPVYLHPTLKKIVPAPVGTRAGQKIEAPEDVWTLRRMRDINGRPVVE